MLNPILKWAGGKRRYIDLFFKEMPNSFNNFYEPFLGGGALFFNIFNNINKVQHTFFDVYITNKKAFLSDLNKELIKFYSILKGFSDDDINESIDILNTYKIKNSKKMYYNIKSYFLKTDNIEYFCNFLYLNKACFAGVYRVNTKGIFNSNFFYYENLKFPTRNELLNCRDILKNVNLTTTTYLKITPDEKDFVFFDPPYHQVFTAYTAERFLEKDHIELCNFSKKLTYKGVKIMMTNSNDDFIKNLYNDSIFRIKKINSKLNEILIKNY